jgi:large subunit ribosomal protein L22
MISTAKAKYVRMSERKMRYVVDAIRNKRVPEAFSILDRTHRRASDVLKKLLKSAVDSAVKNKQARPEDLLVARIFADGAGFFKRYRSMSMGRAGMVRKRLTHVTVELDMAKRPTRESAQPSEKASDAKAAKKVRSGKNKEMAGAA